MKKKTLLGIALAMALALCIGAAVYAAGGSFTMTYLPGTSDTVTNMPAADSGVGGQPYSVSGTTPQREGYEFIGWTLDYDVYKTYNLNYVVKGDPTYGVPSDTATPDPVPGIRAGSNVTLTSPLSTAWKTKDGSPAPTTASYTVYYIDNATNVELCPSKNVDDKPIGSTVWEDARDIPGWTLVGADTQPLTIKPNVEGKWTFTGWCSDETCTTPITEVTNITADTTVYGKWVYSETTNENEITFYYKEEQVRLVHYTVRYIEEITGKTLLENREVYDVPANRLITEEAKAIEGYTPIDPSITWQVEDGDVIVFVYYSENEDI